VLRAKGILRHGVKSKLKAADLSKPATMERLDEIFEPAAFDSLTAAWDGSYRDLLAWWQTRVALDLADRVKYPADIAAKRGPQGLPDTPRVVVGTIHSVKGGQADVVTCSPISHRLRTRSTGAAARCATPWSGCSTWTRPARTRSCPCASERPAWRAPYEQHLQACRPDAGARTPMGLGR
jgi:hypothetical protein